MHLIIIKQSYPAVILIPSHHTPILTSLQDRTFLTTPGETLSQVPSPFPASITPLSLSCPGSFYHCQKLHTVLQVYKVVRSRLVFHFLWDSCCLKNKSTSGSLNYLLDMSSSDTHTHEMLPLCLLSGRGHEEDDANRPMRLVHSSGPLPGWPLALPVLWDQRMNCDTFLIELW